MRRTDGIRTRSMNARMNRESSGVDGMVAFDNLALVVDPDKI
jgi:hypothetical protein